MEIKTIPNPPKLPPPPLPPNRTPTTLPNPLPKSIHILLLYFLLPNPLTLTPTVQAKTKSCREIAKKDGIVGDNKFAFKFDDMWLEDAVNGNEGRVYLMSKSTSYQGTVFSMLDTFNMTINWSTAQVPEVQSFTVNPNEDGLFSCTSVTGPGGGYYF
ncbi:unnamed protein product [Moneuplotes crassus]|uniref:Uncharacterized protein n=1 Tax=Euplotes crassus TaxID=5936 RepID=A0AAD1UF02_EUPCR|nr:unnamed protein product [Moneuplotes crassus]